MPTLENRRLYLSLCTLYKIIHGHFYFPDNVPNTISVWNHLPQDALTAHSISSFKVHTAPPFM